MKQTVRQIEDHSVDLEKALDRFHRKSLRCLQTLGTAHLQHIDEEQLKAWRTGVGTMMLFTVASTEPFLRLLERWVMEKGRAVTPNECLIELWKLLRLTEPPDFSWLSDALNRAYNMQ